MQKTLISTLLTTCTLLLVHNAQAATIELKDPVPAVEAVKDAAGNITKPATGGLRYKWTVTMGANDNADLVGWVGAKSAYEPTFKGTDVMWTHTSNWVALDLTADAEVTITVTRQAGVQEISMDTKTDPAKPKLVEKVAGNLLHPVVSVFKNWEENTADTSQSNPIGRAAWQKEVEYMGIAYADNGATTTTFKGNFMKGKYSLSINGANGWPGNGCQATNTACYTGNHGYRATITTK